MGFNSGFKGLKKKNYLSPIPGFESRTFNTAGKSLWTDRVKPRKSVIKLAILNVDTRN